MSKHDSSNECHTDALDLSYSLLTPSGAFGQPSSYASIGGSSSWSQYVKAMLTQSGKLSRPALFYCLPSLSNGGGYMKM